MAERVTITLSTARRLGRMSRTAGIWFFVLAAVAVTAGCGIVNVGDWKGIEWTSPDEQYYRVKDVFFTAGSAAHPRDTFDHSVQPNVHLMFIPRDERNHYVSKSTWIDPSGVEYRTIRQTHDKKLEEKEGDERNPEGTTRIHTMPTKELAEHEKGLWKVELYIDDELVRRLTLNIR